MWCEELAHWKRPWCWERLREGGDEVNKGWDGWMASLTQWTWIWASSRKWWRSEEPGVLQSMRSQRVRHDSATEQWKDITKSLLGGEDHFTLRVTTVGSPQGFSSNSEKFWSCRSFSHALSVTVRMLWNQRGDRACSKTLPLASLHAIHSCLLNLNYTQMLKLSLFLQASMPLHELSHPFFSCFFFFSLN